MFKNITPTMKRLIAFILAVIMLFGISGLVYINRDRGQSAPVTEDEAALNDIYTSYNAVQLLLSQEKYDEVYSAADRLLAKITPEEYPEIYSDMYLKKACVDVINGNEDSAFANTEEALRVTPNLQEAYMLRAGIYTDRGDYESAAAELEKYTEVSGDYSTYMNLGAWAMQTEDYAKAESCFSKYINNYLTPKGQYDDAWYYRGVCFLAVEKYAEAAEDFKVCIDHEIKSDESLFNVALCHVLLEDYESAKTEFEQCVEKGINLEESKAYLELCNQMLKLEKEQN